MQKVIKLYPGTKEAALAAWDLIDNKLCGDRAGLPKCPEMEAGLYEKYVDQAIRIQPEGGAGAVHEATYRRRRPGVDMYLVQEENRKRSEQAAARVTQGLADRS